MTVVSEDKPLGGGWSDLPRLRDTPTPTPMAVQMTTITRRLKITRTAVRHLEFDSDLADLLAPSSSWVTTNFRYLIDESIAIDLNSNSSHLATPANYIYIIIMIIYTGAEFCPAKVYV